MHFECTAAITAGKRTATDGMKRFGIYSITITPNRQTWSSSQVQNICSEGLTRANEVFLLFEWYPYLILKWSTQRTTFTQIEEHAPGFLQRSIALKDSYSEAPSQILQAKVIVKKVKSVRPVEREPSRECRHRLALSLIGLDIYTVQW